MTAEGYSKGTFYIGPQMLRSTHLSSCHAFYGILFYPFHLVCKEFDSLFWVVFLFYQCTCLHLYFSILVPPLHKGDETCCIELDVILF